jgi:hypothetical protein
MILRLFSDTVSRVYIIQLDRKMVIHGEKLRIW